jgi:lipopolysaccharide/colanic/teichoic acid biosynthesis glycosyltransferase
VKTRIRGSATGAIWRNPQLLETCERERVQHRNRNGRITYDCENAKVTQDRVHCTRGKILCYLSLDGSLYLLAVLRGRTSCVCKRCAWFKSNNEDE